MHKISAVILRVEENIAAALLCVIATLIFISAIARTAGHPINWAGDASLLAFGWLTFLGSDVIIRHRHLIRIDIIEQKLPKGLRKALTILFDIFMVLLILLLGCTLAVPTGSVLMLQSLIEKFIGDIRGTADAE